MVLCNTPTNQITARKLSSSFPRCCLPHNHSHRILGPAIFYRPIFLALVLICTCSENIDRSAAWVEQITRIARFRKGVNGKQSDLSEIGSLPSLCLSVSLISTFATEVVQSQTCYSMTMSSPSLPYSSIRRSARPSVRTEPQIDPATLPSQFNVSRESSSLLQLLQLLSYHEVKHRSVTLNEGFNRGAALGEGASYRVKESILPTDGFLHHLYLRNPPIGDVEVSTFEDAAEEKWTPDSRGAYKGTSDYSTLIRELRILCHQPLYEKEYIVRLGGLAWVSNPVAQGDNLPQEKPIILVESAKRGSLLQFMRSDEWRQGSEGPSLRAKLRICMRVLRCITVSFYCNVFRLF
jgi:hypothetical protein